MRIVSSTCSNTQIVSWVGCADMLVDGDDHSNDPLQVVAALPRVGPDFEINVEWPTDFRPDLVVASLTMSEHGKVGGCN